MQDIFDDYEETMEIFRQIDRLTWAYAVDTRLTPIRRGYNLAEYADTLKKSIVNFVDARVGMLIDLIMSPDFHDFTESADPAASGTCLEKNPEDQTPSPCTTPSPPPVCEAQQESDAP